MAISETVRGDWIMRHRIGFIGTGEIARIHAEAIRRLEMGWVIAGGYDVNSPSCSDFCGIYGGTSYRSAEALLKDPRIDTVYICTRHDSHISYSDMTCRAGKNIFLEKPVAMNFEDVLKLFEIFSKKPVFFAVGYNMRVTPVILKLKEKLKEYKVVPEAFRANMTGTPFMQGWAGDSAYGGGVLVCQGSHMFDLIAYILESPITEVCAEVQWLNQPKELEPNAATILVRLENGVCGTLLMHDRGSKSYHVEPNGGMVNITVYSDQGTFDADAYGKLRYGTEVGFTEECPAGENDIIFRWGYQKEAEYFAGLIDGNTSPLCTLKQAAKTAAVVDAARKSAKEHRWVSITYE